MPLVHLVSLTSPTNSIGSLKEGQGHATLFFCVPQIRSRTPNQGCWWIKVQGMYERVFYHHLILYLGKLVQRVVRELD